MLSNEATPASAGANKLSQTLSRTSLKRVEIGLFKPFQAKPQQVFRNLCGVVTPRSVGSTPAPLRLDDWTDRYGIDTVVAFETRMPKRIAPACERTRTAILTHTLTHGSPLAERLQHHIGNCVVRDPGHSQASQLLGQPRTRRGASRQKQAAHGHTERMAATSLSRASTASAARVTGGCYPMVWRLSGCRGNPSSGIGSHGAA